MKLYHKLFSLVFATLIFASQSGMAFNLHYCKGALASITFGKYQEVCANELTTENLSKSCCAAKKIESHKKCCKDSKIDLKKISTEDVVIKSFNFEFSPFYLVSLNSEFYNSIKIIKTKLVNFYKVNFASNAPPLYKLYCKYIIYA